MNRRFIKIFFSVAFFLVLGKGLGFFKNMLVASRYGTGFVADIYAFEDGLVNEIYSVFSTFLGCTFIPMYLSIGRKEKERLVNRLLIIGLFFILAIYIMAFLFTKPLLLVLVPGYFELYDIDLIVSITRFNMVNLFGAFLINYMVTILHANELFFFLTLEAIISNIVLVGYLAAVPYYGIWGLVGSRIGANIILIIVLLIINLRRGFIKFSSGFSGSGPYIMEMTRTVLPMLILAVTAQLNYVIDRSMASNLSGGTIAMLNYANVLSMTVYALVGYVITSYAYPVLGKLQDDETALKSTFSEYFIVLCRLVLPIVLTACIFSRHIVALIYGHGKMDGGSVYVVAKILMCYLPGVVAYCIKNYYVKLYYIRKDTKPLAFFDALGCGMNIALNLVLVRMLGVYGLAVATSCSYIFMMMVQMIYSRYKRYSRISLYGNRDIFFATIVCAVLCIFELYFFGDLNIGDLKSKLLCGVIILISVILSISIFNLKYVRIVAERIRHVF